MGSSEQDCILLAVDGEPHTEEAVRWALDLAIGLGMKLNPVHVRDPYLKQFYNDIYAQGREEYLEHVQGCLEEKATKASEAFEAAVRRRRSDLRWSFDVLDGDPVKQLSGLIDRGGRSRRGCRGRGRGRGRGSRRRRGRRGRRRPGLDVAQDVLLRDPPSDAGARHLADIDLVLGSDAPYHR